ncbi:hypothetical protein [uncultured Mucilaginibacter sp.]|nr:hypothetical protein [uncultured Mucilaginibacter sp.]
MPQITNNIVTSENEIRLLAGMNPKTSRSSKNALGKELKKQTDK